MSEFRGFRCNGCGAIIEDPEDRVKEKVYLDGKNIEEAYYRDLCIAKCAPARRAEMPEQNYQPVPKRRRRKTLVAAAH